MQNVIPSSYTCAVRERVQCLLTLLHGILSLSLWGQSSPTVDCIATFKCQLKDSLFNIYLIIIFIFTTAQCQVWLGGREVRTLDLRSIGREFGSFTIEYNPGQVVNTHVPLSPSSIIWHQPMGGDALRLGSNRRSGVALATRHRH